MTIKELAKAINKLIRNGHKEIGKSDVEFFGLIPDENTKTRLEMLGCEVEMVADLFNVSLPKKTITKSRVTTLEIIGL